ncbi:hypothetical protein AC1031_010773 [Aphanomyces cochlioides]|nr:hypothetical protein AC1031_010773 [Aphanomyces cochlioides]
MWQKSCRCNGVPFIFMLVSNDTQVVPVPLEDGVVVERDVVVKKQGNESEIPIVPASYDMDVALVDHPSIRFFLENGKRNRDAVNYALRQVIQARTDEPTR